MTRPTATVLLPTTGDRGPLLRHSVASVLAQTVADLELFIIGDGVAPASRAVIEELASADPRVRFIDQPKHVRRGEPYRHQVLTDQASGRFVAYLCDRDLWLPTHLEELARLLEDKADGDGEGHVDLAFTLRFDVTDDGTFSFRHTADLAEAVARARHESFPNLLPLSFVGHTLDAYRRLPDGWRTTPEGTATDRYMWSQFLDQPWVTVATSPMPTVLYFKRGGHPGLATAERLVLLDAWSPRLTIDGAAVVQREVLAALWHAWADLEVSEQRRRARPWRRGARALGRVLGGS